MALRPFTDAYAVAREVLGVSAGWMRHRGVLVVHGGALVDQPAVSRIIDLVIVEMRRHEVPDAIFNETLIILRPGETFPFGGLEYSANAVERSGVLVQRGVVTVAVGAKGWQTDLAECLLRLWAARAGVTEAGREAEAVH